MAYDDKENLSMAIIGEKRLAVLKDRGVFETGNLSGPKTD